MRRLLTAVLLTFTTAASADTDNQLFILDASGSMWGQIEGTPKIEVAKEVMSDLVGELPDDAHTGLLAYGHRRKGDCKDIESLVELGPLDREATIERIRSLDPKGKTPITGAVEQAVQQLRQIDDSASVVLISDGLESCGGNPCEAVKSARESGVNLRMHVVGFDLGDADPAQLQCMAEAGGGQYFAATDAAELTGALEQAAGVAPGLVIEATANGQPIPVKLWIARAGADEAIVSNTHYRRDNKSEPFDLPAGEYDIAVKPKKIEMPVRRLNDVTLPEGERITKSLDFSPAALAIEVTANGEATPAKLWIAEAGTDEAIISSTHYKHNQRSQPFGLPPGEYDIAVEPKKIDMPARYVRRVTVSAGERVTKTIEFDPGALVLDITANGERIPVRVAIGEAGADEALVTKNSYVQPEPLRLPPGDYDIAIQAKKLDVPVRRLRGVSVQAGQVTEKTIEFTEP